MRIPRPSVTNVSKVNRNMTPVKTYKNISFDEDGSYPVLFCSTRVRIRVSLSG